MTPITSDDGGSSILDNQWQPDPNFVPPTDEKTIGVNNLMSIAWLRRGLDMASAVCRVLIHGGTSETGSGFLVASDLLLTNNHVLPDEATALASVAELNYQLNWAGQFEPSRRYPISRFERTSTELDYTLVRVAGSPGDIFGYVDPTLRAEVAVNDFVTIIQHPNGGPKQIALTDNKVAALLATVLQYTTDTEPGSSGSPVFNQNWQITGLHHAGGNLAGPDGGRYFINEGIRFAAIVRDAAGLLGMSDLLYVLAFGDLRSDLVKIIELGIGPSGPAAAGMELLQGHPSLSIACSDRLSTRTAGEPGALAIAASGVSLGAALMQWTRGSGHEAVQELAASDFPPKPELVTAVNEVLAPGKLPLQVYSDLLARLEADLALVDNLPSFPDELNPTQAASLLVSAVLCGANATAPAAEA